MEKLLVAASVIAVVTALPVRADDIETLRKRVVDLYSGQAAPEAGDGHNAAVEALAKEAQALMARSPATPEPHPDPARPDDLSDGVLGIYRAALTMAQAYAAPGSPLRGSEELKARIEAELARGLKWTRPGTERPGNWHPWMIRIPQVLGPTLLLMEGHADGKLLADSIAALEDLMGEPTLSGANLVWEAGTNLYRGLLRRNAARLDLAYGLLAQELTVHEDGGILEDYSYQFHGRLVHTSGYGSGFAQTAAEMLYAADGTRWAPAEAKRRLFENHLLEHARWVLPGGWYDLSVKGRGILNNGPATAHQEALLLMGALDGPQRERLREAAAQLAALGLKRMPLETAGLADAIAEIKAAPLTGFRHFYVSDFAVFRRPDFYVSVRMYSDRLIDYEGNWGQNLTGWFLCYGLTYFSRSGNELWADRETMRTHLDWDRLPGTTTRPGVHPPKAYSTGTSSFAGGAGSEQGGACAFVLEPAAGDFKALKSCFFFDRGFAALGSGITSSAEHAEHVVTTVTQWAAPEADLPLVLSGDRKETVIEGQARWDNVAWAWHDNVGYLFPTPVTLHGHRRGKLTTLWLDHGNNPRGATYFYIVLPNATLDETRAAAASPPVTVVHLDEKSHLCLTPGDVQNAALVWWQPGQVEEMICDAPAIFYGELDLKANDGRLAITNPLHTEATLHMTVDTDSDAQPSSLPEEVTGKVEKSRLLLEARTAAGRQYRLGLGKVEVRQQPHEDNTAWETFSVRTRTEGNTTWITADIPEPARAGSWRLLIRGEKGHLRTELTDKDIVERPDAGTVRYKWTRVGDLVQSGGFRAVLVTDMHQVTDYFVVPPQGDASD